MKVYFNSLGVITNVDYEQDSLRQGSVGIKLKAIFDGISNSQYTATLNYKRSNNTVLSGAIMDVDSQSENSYNFTFSDEWFFALNGETSLTIYLHDSHNNVIAEGSVQFNIEKTDYDREPTITMGQYDYIVAELQKKLQIESKVVRVDSLPLVGDSKTFYIVKSPTSNTLWEVYVYNPILNQYNFIGSNELDLGDYYTKVEGEEFEREITENVSDINEKVDAIQTQVSSISDGSPKGVFDSLDALSEEYPTGAVGIYVVADTGYWYYWDGSSWEYGGVYQARKNADKSITTEMTNFATQTVNMYDVKKTTYGKINSFGEITNNNSYSISDYIPVKQGEKYTMSKGVRRIAFYNTSKVWQSDIFTAGSNDSPYTTSAMASDGFIMLSLTNSVIDGEYMVVNGEELPSSFVKYGIKIDDFIKANENEEKINILNSQIVDFDDAVLNGSNNIFDLKLFTFNKFFSGSEIANSNTYCISGYIKVKKGDTFVVTCGLRQVAQLSLTKSFVSLIMNSDNINVPTVVSATSDGYLLFVCHKRRLTEAMCFKTEKINLFDYSSCSFGNFLNASDELETNATYDCTDYIKIKKDNYYIFKQGTRQGYYYDVNKAKQGFVSNTAQTSNPLIWRAPIDGYLRINIFASYNGENYYVCELPNEYQKYGFEQINNFNERKKSKKLKVLIKGNEIFVSSSLGSNSQRIINRCLKKDEGRNGLFEFYEDCLIYSNNGCYVIKASDDDITPYRFQETTLGANHGYSQCWRVGKDDKTTADLGSEWSDGTNVFTLIDVDDNYAYFIGQEIAKENYNAPSNVAPSSTLTHVRNATHTGDISVSGIEETQLYPSVNNRKIRIFADGIDVTDKDFYFEYVDNFEVKEEYNIMDFGSILTFAHAYIGTKDYLERIQPNAKISLLYQWQKNGTVLVNSTLMANKNLYLSGGNGIVQAYHMYRNVINNNDRLYRYLGNVLEKNGLNFSTLVDITNGGYSPTMFFVKEDLIDQSMPVNKIVDWVKDASNNKLYGFAVGYIPDKGFSSLDKRLDLAYWYAEIRSTAKMYPNAFNTMPNDNRILEKGKCTVSLGYRSFLSNDQNEKSTLCKHVEVGNDCYVFIDYNQTVELENYELNDYAGQSIEVLRKSESFTLNSDIVSETGIIFSIAGNYGWAILKIHK